MIKGVEMYSYHNTIKKLIREGHLIKFEIVDRWNAIAPALVLYFDNHRPMPVRQYNQNSGANNWDMYWPLINKKCL